MVYWKNLSCLLSSLVSNCHKANMLSCSVDDAKAALESIAVNIQLGCFYTKNVPR